MVALLKLADTLVNCDAIRQVQRGKHLALDDREVAIDLIQPTGMRRRMHAAAIGIGLLPTGRRCARIRRRTTIDNSEGAFCGRLRFALHGQIDWLSAGHDARVASMRPNTWSLPLSGAAR